MLLKVLDSKRHFNSIKVRLKPVTAGLAGAGLLFQFHKGTIKTRANNASAVRNEISIP